MTGRRWIKHRYPAHVETMAICQYCQKPFTFVKVTKARKYHRHCAHDVRLRQMRNCNQFIRDLERAARENVSA